MNLLEFAIEADNLLETVSSDLFAITFVQKKMECWKYNNDLVTSSSHGISFFKNVIKYWDDPDSYYKQDPKNKNKGEDYELNFVKILKLNKQKITSENND
jgi:hypothetical protein